MTAPRQSSRLWRILWLGCAVLAGCDHSPLFVTASPDSLGPHTTTLPRRLTYSTGDDRHPTVVGGVLADACGAELTAFFLARRGSSGERAAPEDPTSREPPEARASPPSRRPPAS